MSWTSDNERRGRKQSSEKEQVEEGEVSKENVEDEEVTVAPVSLQGGVGKGGEEDLDFIIERMRREEEGR